MEKVRINVKNKEEMDTLLQRMHEYTSITWGTWRKLSNINGLNFSYPLNLILYLESEKLYRLGNIDNNTISVDEYIDRYLTETPEENDTFNNVWACYTTVDDVMSEDRVREITQETLNTNNKEPIMNIQDAAVSIANEEYFDNKKNIKEIQKQDTDMKELIEWLEKAYKDIQGKYYKIEDLNKDLNQHYINKDSTSIKNILDMYKDIREFMKVYWNNTVADLGKPVKDETKFDVEEFFND